VSKRAVKHSSLISKLSSSRAVSSRVSKPLKRNRKPKALVGGNLKGLEDALPDADITGTDGQLSSTPQSVSEVKRALVAGQSLKSRQGLQKRKTEVERVERERFKGNLDVLGKGEGTQEGAVGETAGGSSTWAALRAHIASSMSAHKQPMPPK
jgi:hypothetical protein